MKTILPAIIIFLSTGCSAQNKPDTIALHANAKKAMIVDAACSECQMGYSPNGCTIAVRFNGQSYMAEGINGISADAHAYGKAHSKNGMCKAVRKAEVQGEVVNGRFRLSSFKLVDSAGSSSVIKF